MNNTSFRVRQITDAAIITALYSVIFLISRFTGTFLEYNFLFALPLPIALYAYKYDFKLGVIPFFSTTLISIFACANPLFSIIYIVPSLFIGVLFGGILIKTKLNTTIDILLVSIICLACEVLSGIVLSSILGIDDIFKEIELMIKTISDMFSLLKISPINLNLLQALLEGIIPSVFIVLALFDAIMFYFIFVIIVNRLRMFKKIESKPKFKFDIAPRWLAIIYMSSFILGIIGLYNFLNENTFIHILCVIAINLHIVLTLVMMYFGSKLMLVYFRYHNMKWGVILVLLSILIPPFQYVLSILGIVDSFSKYSIKTLEKILAQK